MRTRAHGADGLADFARPISQATQDFLQILEDLFIDQHAILEDLTEAQQHLGAAHHQHADDT